MIAPLQSGGSSLVGPVVLLVGGVGLFWLARRNLLQARSLEAADPVQPWQVEKPVHKLYGKVRLDTEFVADPYAPFTEDPAVYARYRTKKKGELDLFRQFEFGGWGSYVQPFLLGANGSYVFVNPASASVYLEGTERNEIHVEGGKSPPPRIEAFIGGSVTMHSESWQIGPVSGEDRWFTQEYVSPGSRVTVYGELTPREEADITDDAREVLRKRGIRTVVESGDEHGAFLVYNGGEDDVIRRTRLYGTLSLVGGTLLVGLAGALLFGIV